MITLIRQRHHVFKFQYERMSLAISFIDVIALWRLLLLAAPRNVSSKKTVVCRL